MKPAELRDLAKWHDEEAKGRAPIGCKTKHAQSARALRAFADVLEAEPVAYMSRHSEIERWIVHEGEMNLWENHALIIKPTLNGDDNGAG